MSYKPTLMGYKENSTNRDKHIIHRGISIVNNFGSTDMDEIVLGMDLEPKNSLAKSRTRKESPTSNHHSHLYKANSQDLAITDGKSLYDRTTRTETPNFFEVRTQLLARSIKDALTEGIRLHWVHSGAQLADALTKVMEANFLRETLRNGHYRLHDSEEILKNRASDRNRLKWLRASTDQKCPRAENL